MQEQLTPAWTFIDVEDPETFPPDFELVNVLDIHGDRDAMVLMHYGSDPENWEWSHYITSPIKLPTYEVDHVVAWSELPEPPKK